MQLVIDPTSGFSKQGKFREALRFSTCTRISWADLSVDDVIEGFVDNNPDRIGR